MVNPRDRLSPGAGAGSTFGDGRTGWLGRLGHVRNVVRQEMISRQLGKHLRTSSARVLEITVELSPTASGTHMHMTQEAPDFTEEQRKATIAGWQTFFDVLQQIAEAP